MFETDPEQILRTSSFFSKRLARGLVRDEHLAEDLVQQDWAAALTDAPREAHRPRSLRAWLARVVRTRAANLRRDSGRAREREVAAARLERTEDQPRDDPGVARELELQALPEGLEVQRLDLEAEPFGETTIRL